MISGDNADMFFNIYGLFYYYMVVGGGEKEKLALSFNTTSIQSHYIMRRATDAGIAGAVIWNNDQAETRDQGR